MSIGGDADSMRLWILTWQSSSLIIFGRAHKKLLTVQKLQYEPSCEYFRSSVSCSFSQDAGYTPLLSTGQ